MFDNSEWRESYEAQEKKDEPQKEEERRTGAFGGVQ